MGLLSAEYEGSIATDAALLASQFYDEISLDRHLISLTKYT